MDRKGVGTGQPMREEEAGYGLGRKEKREEEF